MTLLIILLSLFILIIIGPWAMPFVSGPLKKTIISSLICGLFIVLITLFVINQSGLVAVEQTEFIQWPTLSKKLSGEALAAKEWAESKFIFIDDSYSNQLIRKPKSNKLGNSTITITNRNELAGLFNFLKKNDSLTDMVLCDIYLDQPADNDDSLRAILSEPAIEAKLVMAKNSSRLNTNRFATLNDSVYGIINEKGTEDGPLFATYSPLSSRGNSFSYRVYQKLNHNLARPTFFGLCVKEITSNKPTKIGLSSYIPIMRLTNEEDLYGNAENETQGSASDFNYFELGDLDNEANQDLFKQILGQRRKENKQNIIFIGSFKGEDIDIHNTYFGRLHGSTILLNLIYSLDQGDHLISFSYVLVLWLGLSAILFIMFRLSSDKSLISDKLKKAKPKKKATTGLKGFGQALCHILIIDSLHTWLLVIFALFTYWFCERILNCFALILLFQFIAAFFNYYHNHLHGKK